MNQSNPGIGPIRWQDYTHQHMWNMLMAANPEAMFQEAEKATTLANEMGDITDFAHAIAQDVVGAWSGGAADNAAASITEFLQWADHTANTVNKVAGLLSQYAHVVNRARLSIPAPVDGQTATQAAGAKTHAEHVMEHYTSQSRTIDGELAQHQFPAPPGATGLPLPAPEPTRQPHPEPPHQPTHDSTAPPLDTTTTTTSSAMPASQSGGALSGGALSGPGGIGGTAGGSPDGAVANGLLGDPGMSAVGATEAETGLARMAAAAEGQAAGWSGFAPTPPVRSTDDGDGEHRDRYSGRPDLIGELPPAFPPVLGL
jgi:hypothetical protein